MADLAGAVGALNSKADEHPATLRPLPLVRVLVATGELRGAHVHVTMRGEGPDGSRPLLGTLVMSEREWDVLRDCLSLDDNEARP